MEKSQEIEVWKIHEPSGYEVSSFGRVKGKFGKMLKTSIHRDGYPYLALYIGSLSKNYVLHRLVYETFLGRIPSGMVINHKNGIKTDARLENLECMTHSENMLHYSNSDFHNIKVGQDKSQARLTDEEVKEIYSLILKGYRVKDIASKFKINSSSVSNIKNGTIWKHLFKDSGIDIESLKKQKRNAFTKEQIIKFYRLRDEGASIKEIALKEGASWTSIYEIFKKTLAQRLNKDNKPIDFSKIDSYPNENWKQHESGLYISDLGRVIGYKRKILTTQVNKNGYSTVSSREKSHLVHRLVIETFLGEIQQNLCVNHIDGNKTNNILSNLEVVTPSQNSKHSHLTGLSKYLKGELSPVSVLTNENVFEIYELIKSGAKNKDIADKFKVGRHVISAIKSGKSWVDLWLSPRGMSDHLHLIKARIKLTESKINEIVDLLLMKTSLKVISSKYGIPIGIVKFIDNNLNRKPFVINALKHFIKYE